MDGYKLERVIASSLDRVTMLATRLDSHESATMVKIFPMLGEMSHLQ